MNRISPGSYTSITRVDFKALDDALVTPVGIYGSDTEIVAYLKVIEAITEEQ